MKRRLNVILFMILIIVFISGCTKAKDLDRVYIDNALNEDVTISWDLITNTEIQNDVEVYVTDIILFINDEKYVISKTLGVAEQYKGIDKEIVSDKTIYACRSWFAGAGMYVIIDKVSNKKLEVYEKYVYESIEGPSTDEKSSRELIKVIIFKNSAEFIFIDQE